VLDLTEIKTDVVPVPDRPPWPRRGEYPGPCICRFLTMGLQTPPNPDGGYFRCSCYREWVLWRRQWVTVDWLLQQIRAELKARHA
jgi:hypothetical protein